jgi:hypothetical protein
MEIIIIIKNNHYNKKNNITQLQSINITTKKIKKQLISLTIISIDYLSPKIKLHKTIH